MKLRTIGPGILWCATFLVSGCSEPPLPEAEMSATAKRQADAMGAAYLSKDYGKLADCTHPKVIEAAGGRERMIATMRAEGRKADTEGFSMRAVRMGEPQQLSVAGSRCYVIVSEYLEMSVPGGRLKSESYLIGASEDGGRTWAFVDGAGFGQDAAEVRRILPGFPSGMKLPARKAPVYERGRT